MRELQLQLGEISGGRSLGAQKGDAEQQRKMMEQYLKNFEASLSSQFNTARRESRPTGLDLAIDQLRELSEKSFALLRAIRRHHLSRDQYKRLLGGRLSEAISELRSQGLLVPVVHKTDGGDVPCYYMPAGISKVLKEAMLLLPQPSEDLENEIEDELKRIGYR